MKKSRARVPWKREQVEVWEGGVGGGTECGREKTTTSRLHISAEWLEVGLYSQIWGFEFFTI